MPAYLQATFETENFTFSWDYNPDNDNVIDVLSKYVVEFWSIVLDEPEELKATYEVTPTVDKGGTFTFTLAQNILAFGTAARSFWIKIYSKDSNNELCAFPTEFTATNEVPPVPTTVVITTGIDINYINITPSSDTDIVGFVVYRDTNQGFTPSESNKVYEGTNTYITLASVQDTTYYYRVSQYDHYGKVDLNISQEYVSSIPTSLPDYVQNALGTPSIYQDSFANRPTGTEGEVFIDRTNKKIQVFNGTIWEDYGSAGSSLPSQTGNNGKFLTTDGSDASWDTVPAPAINDLLPSQTGNNGKVLTTDGTDPSWAGIETGGLVITDFCTLKIGSAQSTTRDATNRLLNFDTLNTGDSSFLSVSDKGFKIPTGKAGYYSIFAKYQHSGSSGLANMSDVTTECYKNGTLIETNTIGFYAGSWGAKCVPVNIPIIYLNENDILTFKYSVYSTTNDTDALNITNTATLASLIRYEKSIVGNVTVEYDYVQVSSNVTISSTDINNPTNIISGNSVYYDGNTRIKIEFTASAAVDASSTNYMSIGLWDGSTLINRNLGFVDFSSTGSFPVKLEKLITPSAGTHSYSIKAVVSGSGSFYIYGGDGSGTNQVPITLRITNANSTVSLPIFKPSGTGHAVGIVPDPPASAGTSKFLCEDATWKNPIISGTPISTATGNVGEIRFDSDYLYICIATNTWKRITLSSY